MYYYKVYDWIVGSEIEIPQLITVGYSSKVDVFIKCCDIPNMVLDRIREQKEPAGQENGYYWVNTPAGYILIKGDNEITIQVSVNVDYETIRTYILGYGLAFIALKRNMLAIHCCAIEKDGESILIMGLSGAGKSTLADRFIMNGFSLVADDMVVIEQRHNNIIAHSAFPVRKLCRDAVERLDYDITKLQYIDETKDKFAINCTGEFCEKQTKVKALLYLDIKNNAEIELKEYNSLDKLMTLVKNLFLYIYFKKYNILPWYMQKCIEIANKVPIYGISRPNGNIDTSQLLYEKVMRGIWNFTDDSI